MNRILSLKIFRFSFLNTKIVDTWLVSMLQTENCSGRVIDYFEILSNLDIYTALDIRGKARKKDKFEFIAKRENIIKHIANMDGLLETIFTLNDDELSRACSTYVIQRLLELSMDSSSFVYLMVFDFSIHLLFLLCFNV